ncbi:MAG: hypothetical protein ACYDD4_01490 [Acidimicrobiales bacterium]
MPEQLHMILPGTVGAQARPERPAATRPGEDWRIDAKTRLAGLEGIRRARAALAAAAGQEASEHVDAA